MELNHKSDEVSMYRITATTTEIVIDVDAMNAAKPTVVDNQSLRLHLRSLDEKTVKDKVHDPINLTGVKVPIEKMKPVVCPKAEKVETIVSNQDAWKEITCDLEFLDPWVPPAPHSQDMSALFVERNGNTDDTDFVGCFWDRDEITMGQIHEICIELEQEVYYGLQW